MIIYDTLRKRVVEGQTDKGLMKILEKKKYKDKDLYEMGQISEVLSDGTDREIR